MNRLKWFHVYCCAVMLIVSGCSTAVSMKTLSLPTPWGPVVVDFDKEKKRGVQAKGDLKVPPQSIAQDPKLSADYYSFLDYGFGIWVPVGCKFDSGSNIVLRADYSAELKKSIEDVIENQKKKYGHLPIDTAATNKLLQSPAKLYAFGKQITVKFTKDSVINGWKVAEGGLEKMKSIGEEKLILPSRQVMITVIEKNELFPGEFSSAPPNLMRWTTRFDVAYNIDSIYGDKDTGFLYERYRWILKNVEKDGMPDRNVVIEGLRAYFAGGKYYYLIDITAMQGEVNDRDWNELLLVLESFKFLKGGSE